MAELESAEPILKERLARESRLLAAILIDLGIIAIYAIVVGGAAVLLHLWVHWIENRHLLSQTELVPFKLLASALAWIDCAGVGFASVVFLVETVLGRGKVFKGALDAFRR